MPTPQIRYPSGAFGYSGNDPQTGGSYSETFEAAGVIAAGAGVEFDFTQTTYARVKSATTNPASPALWIGVAAEAAAAAGDAIPVTMGGFAVARCSVAITAGDRLGASTATAGEVAPTALTPIGSIVAIALESKAAAAGSRIRVLVTRL